MEIYKNPCSIRSYHVSAKDFDPLKFKPEDSVKKVFEIPVVNLGANNLLLKQIWESSFYAKQIPINNGFGIGLINGHNLWPTG